MPIDVEDTLLVCFIGVDVFAQNGGHETPIHSMSIDENGNDQTLQVLASYLKSSLDPLQSKKGLSMLLIC